MIAIIAPSLDDKRIFSVPQLRPGTVQRSSVVFRHASGKGANAARAAAALGAGVTLCAPVGSAMRRIVVEQLADSGIRLHLVDTVQPTRSCITILEEDGRATELVQEALPLDVDEASAFRDAALDLVGSSDIVLLAGSLPPGLADDFYLRCAQQAQARAATVIVDAQRLPLLRVLEVADCVVKINREELGNTLGTALSPEDVATAAQRLAARTAATVIVTDGAGPVHVSREGKPSTSITPPSVIPVNPVGSGDSMSGALACALDRGWALEDALSYAVAAGAANAASLLPGDVEPALLQTLLGSVS
jgi:1-phosphofructokinase family hexose kinase